MPQPFTYKEFQEIYSKVPRLTVDVIIQTDTGILLTKRNIIPFKDYWHIPGGTVYHGEDLEAAVKRVALEEVGIVVKVGQLLGYIEYRSIAAETPFDSPISFVFQAAEQSGELRPVSQSTELDYFTHIPNKCIPEHSTFLTTNGLIKT